LKIAILGTRGIPNRHGGFEQFAEHFSVYLAETWHKVYVYNSHDHTHQDSTYKMVNIVHCYDPEYKIGTAGQFIYDFNCIRDARKRNFDVILQLGYTSSSIWHWLMPKTSIVITNMDGMEWKRSKYSKKVRKFLKYAEKLAVKYSDFLISDSIGIQEYLLDKYQKSSKYIAYGATAFDTPDPDILCAFNLEKYKYCILIARLEPENNIDTILEGYTASNTPLDLIIFGALNDYGKWLQKKYIKYSQIRFLGANYNQENLNNLRYYSRYYFHGHSVGGTNPSLLEAMASNSLIIANDNIFNKSILGEDAFYFQKPSDITKILMTETVFGMKETFGKRNSEKIENLYSWNKINHQYESFILKCNQ